MMQTKYRYPYREQEESVTSLMTITVRVSNSCKFDNTVTKGQKIRYLSLTFKAFVFGHMQMS